MAYSPINKLLKVKKVNEVYLKFNKMGVSTEFIYLNHIREVFHIGRSTFYTYLTINYKKELRELGYEVDNNDESQD